MMHLLAPAKINLHLRVGRRRDDGFHPLLTWMCTVGLFDRLTLEADADVVGGGPSADERAGTGSEPPGDARRESVGLSICGDGDRPDLPRDGRNLVVRIATAFVDELRRDRAAGNPAGRATPAAPPPKPAFRKEGYWEPESETPGGAWAAPRTGAGSTASAGATPKGTPGNVGEDSPVSGVDVMRVQAAAGSAGVGVGVVREAEGSGRSNRRDGGGVEGSARGAGRPDALSNAAAPGAAHDPEYGAAHNVAREPVQDWAFCAAPLVRVTLDKRVPIGAGLGGGSSDAAHTLVALDRLLNAGWAAERLSSFAARFGSDVPFFVAAALGRASCACRGRGEVVRPVARPRAKWAVVFSPPFGLSTRDVYARFDEMGLGFDAALAPGAEPDWDAWAALAARGLLEMLVNDLEPAAFSLSADLGRLREGLEGRVGRVVRMSGSGSSLFTLFDENEEPAAREAVRVGERLGAASCVVDVTPGGGGLLEVEVA